MDNPAHLPILKGMKTDLIIVGGGLNGPALAIAAARAGFRVTVIDTLPKAARKMRDFDGRSYALALASQRLLRVQPSIFGQVLESDDRTGRKIVRTYPEISPIPGAWLRRCTWFKVL